MHHMEDYAESTSRNSIWSSGFGGSDGGFHLEYAESKTLDDQIWIAEKSYFELRRQSMIEGLMFKRYTRS